jgi:putative peptidoglycan binding protein
MRPNRTTYSALALAGLAACTPQIGALGEPQVSRQTEIAPPGAAPGTCWGKQVAPAIIETVTEQLLLQPAEVLTDGTVIQPAVYKTETQQRIVRERRETWFRTPCAEDLTEDFVASLQRALAARGLFDWPVSGEMDARTRAAVRRYQQPQGLDSGILSLAAAQQMGLVIVDSSDNAG